MPRGPACGKIQFHKSSVQLCVQPELYIPATAYRSDRRRRPNSLPYPLGQHTAFGSAYSDYCEKCRGLLDDYLQRDDRRPGKTWQRIKAGISTIACARGVGWYLVFAWLQVQVQLRLPALHSSHARWRGSVLTVPACRTLSSADLGMPQGRMKPNWPTDTPQTGQRGFTCLPTDSSNSPSTLLDTEYLLLSPRIPNSVIEKHLNQAEPTEGALAYVIQPANLGTCPLEQFFIWSPNS